MPGVKDKLIDVGYAAGWSLVCRLPESLDAGGLQVRRRHRLAPAGSADPGPRGQPGARARAGGRRRSAARRVAARCMRRYARYWLEIFRLPVMPVQLLVDGMPTTTVTRAISDSIASGRGVVIASAAHGQLGPGRGMDHQPGSRLLHNGHGAAQARERLRNASLRSGRASAWRCYPPVAEPGRSGSWRSG